MHIQTRKMNRRGFLKMTAAGTATLAMSRWPCGAEGTRQLGTEPPLPNGRRLREIVADKYPTGNVFVGAASKGRSVMDNVMIATILDREFSYVTPANDFKQTTAHPHPGSGYDWRMADMWLQYAAKHKKVLRIHGPISPQCSDWARDDSRTAAEMNLALEEYVTALCKHISPSHNVRWLDVVNETIDDDGTWFGRKPRRWSNPWPIIGFDTDPDKTPLYISKAFTIANQLAPNIRQLINEHALTPQSVAKMKGLVKYLRGKGLRVDGVCWQGHIEDPGWEKGPGHLDLLGEFIAWSHENKLEFHVTEFQAQYFSKAERRQNEKVTADEMKRRLSAQAETYAAVMNELLKHRTSGIVTMNFWQLTDSEAQNKGGCMFNEEGSPRPAYYAVQNVLENPPRA